MLKHTRQTKMVDVKASYMPEPAVPFTPHAAKTVVTVPGGIPIVEITDRAYHDMLYLVDIVPVEVGWLGTVTVIGNVYRIDEVFILDQEVNGTQCELSADSIAEWATKELLSHENGVDRVNRLRFWGHSHGLMGTAPSGQDDRQTEEFRGDCDFFVRGIFNKIGAARFDVYRFDLNLAFLDVSWRRVFVEDVDRRMDIERQVRECVHERATSLRSPRQPWLSGKTRMWMPQQDTNQAFENYFFDACERYGVNPNEFQSDDIRMIRQVNRDGSPGNPEGSNND